MGGSGNTWVGAFSAAFLGVITIAAIYQLNIRPTVANDVTTLGTTTLGNLFK